tara:strand:- start:951 stop:1100 length:150 start_codon:yes stop_codon:yes gene_type:complete
LSGNNICNKTKQDETKDSYFMQHALKKFIAKNHLTLFEKSIDEKTPIYP